MNVYQNFFKEMNNEEWEFFATDVLFSLEFAILELPSRGADGGKDAIVEKDGIRYIVSAKHFILSGKSVGVSDEQSINDRIIQHNAQGFIGFYSTLVSTALMNRLESMRNSFNYLIFDEKNISNFLAQIDSSILQKYGLPNNVKYVMNVSNYDYTPLKCLECELDILSDDLIRLSLAQISLNENNELEFLYGCKSCLFNYSDMGWIEVYESLHLDRLNGWNNFIDDRLNIYPPSKSFYKNKNEYDSRIQQRIYPSNWGKHILTSLHM